MRRFEGSDLIPVRYRLEVKPYDHYCSAILTILSLRFPLFQSEHCFSVMSVHRKETSVIVLGRSRLIFITFRINPVENDYSNLKLERPELRQALNGQQRSF